MKIRKILPFVIILSIVMSLTSCGGPDFEKIYEDVKEDVSKMEQKDKYSYVPSKTFDGICTLTDDKDKIIIESSFNEKGYGGTTDLLMAIAVAEHFEAAKDFSKMFVDKFEMSNNVYNEIEEALSGNVPDSGNASDKGVKVSWETTGLNVDLNDIKNAESGGKINFDVSYEIVFEKDL